MGEGQERGVRWGRREAEREREADLAKRKKIERKERGGGVDEKHFKSEACLEIKNAFLSSRALLTHPSNDRVFL